MHACHNVPETDQNTIDANGQILASYGVLQGYKAAIFPDIPTIHTP